MLITVAVATCAVAPQSLCRKVEKDEFCQEVLNARMIDGVLDKGPIHDDIVTFAPTGCALDAEAMVGGWPCQAVTTDHD